MTRYAASALFLCVALFGLAPRAGAQISPGPLARAHAELEGALNCARCHGPKKGAMNASCQSCHKEIAWLVERNRGYHAGRDAKAKSDCSSCHPDHAGRDFALIAWPGGSSERFDHRAAGWALDGGHLEVKCRECHTADYRSSEAARLSKRSNVAGWTGLETTCASCHAGDDIHRGALRKACDDCHDTRDWKKASRFSHDSTAYALTGKHADVECNACHLGKRLPVRNDSQGRPIPVYTPVAFRSCADCHDDPHRGRLSTRCAECHSPKGFTTVESRAFNHSLTRYALLGRHARVPCAQCHGADMAKPKPAFDRCVSCHADPHNASAILNGKPADCDACHRVDGFAPSTFTVARHASSPYPLEGRHAQVACVKCHAPVANTDKAAGPRIARLRMPFARCTDCHADAHGGQLAKRADVGACEGCHAVAGWTPSTFTPGSHASLSLALEGRHAEAPCRACHGATRQGLPAPGAAASLGSAGVAVTLAEKRCADCHVDPHQGRYSAGGPLAMAGECATCHSATAFRPTLVTSTQHDRLGFALDGAHRAIACVGCHSELQGKPATSTLLLSSRGVTRFPASTTSRTCATCHQNPHGEQFAEQKARCESCHGTEAFSPASRFDHERGTSFSLRGAHARVACASCHTTKDAKGVPTTIYRPLSGKCESCHDRRRVS